MKIKEYGSMHEYTDEKANTMTFMLGFVIIKKE